MVERAQRYALRGYRAILVPDAEGDDALAGDLAHDLDLDWHGKLVYIGPLSELGGRETTEDIDYFFSISGVEPHHSMLAERVLAALPAIRGRSVVALGRPGAGDVRTVGNATIHGYLDRHAQAEMLARARVIVGRSGYTTLMEAAGFGKRALFVPTPGQSEQEYLARLHGERGRVFSTVQSKLDIPRDLARAEAASGLPRLRTDTAVPRFLDLVR
jgi:hypothetical protein